jgi:hypothetical protein
MLAGYGSESSTTLDSDFLRKIPYARRARARRAVDPCRGERNLSTSHRGIVGVKSYRTVRSGAVYKMRVLPYKLLDTSAAGPDSWNPAIWGLKLP